MPSGDCSQDALCLPCGEFPLTKVRRVWQDLHNLCGPGSKGCVCVWGVGWGQNYCKGFKNPNHSTQSLQTKGNNLSRSSLIDDKEIGDRQMISDFFSTRL